MISSHLGGISLTLRKSPYSEVQNFLIYLTHLLTWNFRSPYLISIEFPSFVYLSIYLGNEISLFDISDVSHDDV